jgi:hypothetical protein
MTDDRLLDTFSLLNEPVRPATAFEDTLFEDLATELGFRRASRPAGLGARIRRAIGLERLPAGSQAFRVAYLLAMVGLLIAMLGALLVISQRHERPAPAELVRLSQAAYAHAPAVRYTIHDAMGDYFVASDGNGTWRSEGWDMAPGSYMLYDGTRTGIYDATLRSWDIVPVEQGGPPFPMNNEFNWVRMSFPGLVATIEILDCSDAVDAGDAQVAGRTADHVRCPGLGLEYWLDRDTHLVLRVTARYGTNFWDGAPSGAPLEADSVAEVTSFQEVTSPSAADFAWTGPSNGSRTPGPVPGTTLVIGSPPPAWTGTTIGGTSFDVRAVRSPAALLLMWPSIGSGARVYDTFNAAAAAHPGVTAVVVGLEEVGTMVGFTTLHPTSLTVVADGDQTIASAWGTLPIPEIVLIDAGGSVADVVRADLAPADLDAILGALEDGRPVPPAPAPATSAESSPGMPTPTPAFDFECTDSYVICRRTGDLLPAWSGQQLSGGTFDSSELAGMPAVIWFTHFPNGELRAFGSLADAYADRVTLLVIIDGEAEPGATKAMLDEAGVDVRVVVDWDGAISRALDAIVGGVLILDRDGRIVDQVPGQLPTPTIRSTLDRLVETATPGASAP